MVSIAGLKVSSPWSHGFLFTGIAVSESPDTGVTEAGILTVANSIYGKKCTSCGYTHYPEITKRGYLLTHVMTVGLTIETLEVSCVIETIKKAKARRNIDKPLILHSDRGSQYVSKEYKRITATMQCSYSKKAYPWDNACIESFHSLIKREWLNRFKIQDYDHAYRLIFEYLEAFYNTKQIHSHCDYMSPNDYEELYRRLQQDELQLAG